MTHQWNLWNGGHVPILTFFLLELSSGHLPCLLIWVVRYKTAYKDRKEKELLDSLCGLVKI